MHLMKLGCAVLSPCVFEEQSLSTKSLWFKTYKIIRCSRFLAQQANTYMQLWTSIPNEIFVYRFFLKIFGLFVALLSPSWSESVIIGSKQLTSYFSRVF